MFKSLDFFPKVLEDQPFRKTMCGGILFVLTFLTIIALLCNEIYMTFIQGELVIDQFVDTSHADERIRVNLNISFHKVPCMALALDLQDVTGTHLEDVQHTIHKLRMDEKGLFIDPLNAKKVQQFEHHINYPSNPLFRFVKKLTDSSSNIEDCYGAQLYEGQKCITCQDVMTAYAARNWPQPPKEAVAQCMPDHKAHIKQQQQQQKFYIQGPGGAIQEINVKMQDVKNALPPGQDRRVIQQNTDDWRAVLKNKEDLRPIKQNQNTDGRSLYQQNIEEQEKLLGIPQSQSIPETFRMTNDMSKYKDLTQEEHTKKFMKTFKELNQLKDEPFSYDQKLTAQEKNAKLQNLVDLMDVDYNEYDDRMNHQIKWQQHDRVISIQKLSKQRDQQLWTNLTSLLRQKCNQDVTITFKLTGTILKDLKINMPEQSCASLLQYRVLDVGVENRIQLRVNEEQFEWAFSFDSEHSYQTLEFQIISITGASYKLYDTTADTFRLQIVQQNNRKLFTEDFGHEPPKQQVVYMEDLAQLAHHTNEGCQVYGHFFIRKVPGNFHVSFHGKGQAAIFLAKQFSIEHTIHLLEFTEEKQELSLGTQIKSTNPLDGVKQQNEIEQDSQYYLKIVGGKYNPLWSSESKLYTFTSHESNQRKKSEARLPQIEFKYEFDAITMIYSSRSRSIFQFLVSLLAIIGGIFSVSNLVSSVLEKIGF